MSEPKPSPGRPLSLPPLIAGGLALVSLVLGMLSMGIGWLPLSVIGLLGIGLAMGLSGMLRHRLLIALLLWLTTTGLTALTVAYGRIAFEVAGPAIFSLLFIGVGQCLGLLAGVLIRQRDSSSSY